MKLQNLKFDFVKQRNKFFILSFLIFFAGVLSLTSQGMNLGIDFSSGTRVEITAPEKLSEKEINDTFEDLGYEVDSIVYSGKNDEMVTAQFLGAFDENEISEIKSRFVTEFGSDEPNVSTVSPQVGRELAKNALLSVLISSIGIILYLSVRFESRMAVAAVIAMLHDVFLVVSLFSLFRFEVDITFIAAILTIIGYSVNDTVVTFDRIRENLKEKGVITQFDELAEAVNRSIKETLMRSINTGLTVLFSAVALMVWGSPAIGLFSLALVIGLTFGMYSSIFIASQIWVVLKWKKIQYDLLHPKEDEEEDEYDV